MKMRRSLLRSGLLLALFPSSLLLCQTAAAAVTFSVTPAAVSNAYAGPITLQVGGLNNGETVVVQEFLDANANGVVEPGEGLVQQFQLTDGVLSVIGGVTNLNVPGDLTPADGAISAQASLLTSGATFVAGPYLYRLSSPTGRFAPLTSVFSVTNLPYAQSLVGNVVCNGTNVPHAGVLVFNGMAFNSSLVASTLADGAGSYTVGLPPGVYSVIAWKGNYVANAATAPTLTLDSGATLSTNLTLLPAACSISGKVQDAANASLGLGGLWVLAESTNGLLALSSTDTNGSFTLPATASGWKLSYNEQQLPSLGYLRVKSSPHLDTTTGSVAGVTLALPKATALFYGRIRDTQGLPLPGIRLAGEDDSYRYGSSAVTDQNGNYVAGALNATWHLGPESQDSPLAANYVFSSASGLTLTNGQALRQDFVGLLATNQISGYLADDSHTPLGGIWVWAEATINGVTFQTGTDTDAMGHYAINIGNGTWEVGVNCGGGGESLSSSYLCPNSQSILVSNNNATANFTALRPTAQISGYVRNRNNNNPLVNVGVYAHTIDYANNAYTTTDGNGYYSFNVINGNWNVGVNCAGSQGLSALGFLCVGEQSVAVTNSTATLNFLTQPAPSQITGYVRDSNSNGIPNVGVFGYNSDTGNNVSGTTDNGGHYVLDVDNGNWTIGVSCGGGSGSLSQLGYFCVPNQTLSVTNGTVTADFTTLQAPYQLSGYVLDSNNQPIVHVGVFVSATLNGTAYNQYTDTDNSGHYAVSVANGLWQVGLNCSGGYDSLSQLGYACVSDQATNVSNASAVVNFTVERPPSQITGYVRDNSNNPIANVGVFANAADGAPVTLNAMTDGTGHYQLNVPNGTWEVAVACGSGFGTLNQLGYLCPDNQTVSVTNGTVAADFVAVSAPYQISGWVKDTSNQPLANLHAWVSATLGTNSYWVDAFTDNNGNYSFNVANGTWTLNLDCFDLNSRGYQCEDSGVPLSVLNASVVTNFIVQPMMPLQLTTTSLPTGSLGMPYFQQLQATGGEPPYAWELTFDSGPLPPGLVLAPDGTLSGTPASSGTFNFSVQVWDNTYQNNASAPLSLTIGAGSNTGPVLTDAVQLPDGQFQFTFPTTSGAAYTIEYSSTLTNWTALWTGSGSGAPLTFTDSSAPGSSHRFYRVKVGP